MNLAPHFPLSSGTVRPAGLVADSYMTDGRRLFRVLAPGGGDSRHTLASLEDCLTLVVYAYSPAEIEAMGLRPVRPDAGS